jgi:hypothetical protein
VVLFGEFVDQDVPDNRVAISSDGNFAPAPQNERPGWTFSTVSGDGAVKAGALSGGVAAQDKVAGRVGTFRETIVVPNGDSRRSRCSIPWPKRGLSSHGGEKPSPFQFGSLEVVSRGIGFKSSGTLNYYQVYNAKDEAGVAS